MTDSTRKMYKVLDSSYGNNGEQITIDSCHDRSSWIIGEWREVAGDAIACNNGFHCCEFAEDCYETVSGDIFAVVEVDGSHNEHGVKEAWSRMRILEAYSTDDRGKIATAYNKFRESHTKLEHYSDYRMSMFDVAYAIQSATSVNGEKDKQAFDALFAEFLALLPKYEQASPEPLTREEQAKLSHYAAETVKRVSEINNISQNIRYYQTEIETLVKRLEALTNMPDHSEEMEEITRRQYFHKLAAKVEEEVEISND